MQRMGTMRVEGFRFTEPSRQDLLEGLAHAIGAQAVRFPDEPGTNGAPSLVEQLESFEYDHTQRGVRYVVPPGMHSEASRSNPARAILDPDIFAVSISRFAVQRGNAEQVHCVGRIWLAQLRWARLRPFTKTRTRRKS